MVESKSSPIKPCIVSIHLHCCYSSEEAGSVEAAVVAEAVSLQGLTDEESCHLTRNTTYSETGSFPENILEMIQRGKPSLHDLLISVVNHEHDSY